MVEAIQDLRQRLGDMDSDQVRIAIELNTSCPNIDNAPPPAYTPESLCPLLAALTKAFWADRTLVLGLKLPPYTYSTQFTEVIGSIANLSRDVEGKRYNPIAFLTCTNTLGNSLLFADQAVSAETLGSSRPNDKTYVDQSRFALPTPVGGLAGEAIHALALGNVHTFSRLLNKADDSSLQTISIIGVGGVGSPAAVSRMYRAGAHVVGCATYLGQEGVRAFELLSSAAGTQ